MFRIHAFRLHTYSNPAVYLEPILAFIESICHLGVPSGLPIALFWNTAARQGRFSDAYWERFKNRVRKGQIHTASIHQYVREDMTMHSPLPLDRPLPFEIELESTPAAHIDPDLRRAYLEDFLQLKEDRYPVNLSLAIVLDEYAAPNNMTIAEYVHGLERDVVTRAGAAYAYSGPIIWMPFKNTLPRFPEDLNDYSLIESLDTHVHGVSWGMFFGPHHLEWLGGKDAIAQTFSEYHVEDISTDEGDRVYVQLTEDATDYTIDIADKVRPFLAPLLLED